MLVLANVLGLFGIMLSPLVADIISGMIAAILAVGYLLYQDNKKEEYVLGILDPGAEQ